jgi:PelA/Pel-15E family pectate lyase
MNIQRRYQIGGILICLIVFVFQAGVFPQKQWPAGKSNDSSLEPFYDSAHHWYDIDEGEKVIYPLAKRPKWEPNEIDKIADNILLFQKSNGGWPKNYDMQAVLSKEQIDSVLAVKDVLNTTFDNGATHSQIDYLVKVYNKTKIEKYKLACLRGIDFALSAQYPNGGFPQFYPDTSGYRKYITFNDGAMIGVLKIFQKIARDNPQYAFVDAARREKIKVAYQKGIDCILKCQIVENGKLLSWCQQHDNIDFRPQNARNFEPASICNGESVEIVHFLMKIDNPSQAVINAIKGAVAWFRESAIHGIKPILVDSAYAHYLYHSTTKDRVVVKDSTAPDVWTRMYELGTHRPIFCNRDKKIVYSLAEVERERRTGYQWYVYAPKEVLKNYPVWLKKNKLTE